MIPIMMPGRLGKASGGPPPFSPLDIAGCGLWLDASDATTLFDATSGGSLPAGGAGVARIEDKSGNSRHYTQSTSGNRPTRQTGVQNGLDVLRFDGSNDGMIQTTNLNILRNVGGCTICVVRKWNANPTANSAIWNCQTPATTGLARAAIAAGISAGKEYTGGRRLDANSVQVINSTNNVSTSAFQTSIGILDYANSDAFLYLNGSLEASTTSFQTSGNTSDTDSRCISLGCSDDNAGIRGAFASIDLSELIVYTSVLSSGEISDVEGYLRDKWAHY